MLPTFKPGDCLGKIPSEEIYGNLLEYAINKGVPLCSNVSKSDYHKYPNIIFKYGDVLDANRSEYGDGDHNWITFEQFFQYCDNWKINNEYVEVKLNNSYTAKITVNGVIEVGCQTFSFETIDEINKAIQTLKAKV